MSQFPQLLRIRQQFARPRVDDIPATVLEQLESLELSRRLKPGDSVAITAGSRGISNIAEIIAATVSGFRALGATPFIVPAMGSHGGATAEGQTDVLGRIGITEAVCGCEIRSSMETQIVADAPLGFPVHIDAHALAADHVFVVGRIKPHTMFAGPYESGLCKMLLIGLGKHTGAKIYHAAAHTLDFQQVVEAIAPAVIKEANVCGGLAIIENGYEDTAQLTAVSPERFLLDEPPLLEQAKAWMPRLPFDDIDVLVIDQMGKNISGAGMDTNIVGRKWNDNRAVEGETPRVHRIVTLDLTEKTHGNAAGVGVADFITQKLFAQIDFDATRINGMTAGHLGGVKIPPVLPTEREAVAAALETIGLTPPHDAGIIRIQDTLHLDEMWLSEKYHAEAVGRDDLEILSKPEAMW